MAKKVDKRDRQGVRTPSDLEQKYDLGSLSSSMGGSNASLGRQVEQMMTTLSQFTAQTTATLTELSEEIARISDELAELREYVDGRFDALEVSPTGEEGEDNE